MMGGGGGIDPKPDAAMFDIDTDDATTPTAAPSRSLDSLDDGPFFSGQYQSSEEEANESSIPTVEESVTSLPAQSRDVFHTTATTRTISVAPTFPAHGALGRFDSEFGDDDTSQDEEQDKSISSGEGDGGGKAISPSGQGASAPVGKRRSSRCGSISSGDFMPQSFRPFEERNSEPTSFASASFRESDANISDTSAEKTGASHKNNNTTPQCRHTPSIITSSEASYIFQQLDEMRMTSPCGITYNKPKYLQPTTIISGDKVADSLPIDAVHAISSYCDGKTWMALCHTSKRWRGVGWEVWMKNRMHAFRCAGEVLLAWVSFKLCSCLHWHRTGS